MSNEAFMGVIMTWMIIVICGGSWMVARFVIGFFIGGHFQGVKHFLALCVVGGMFTLFLVN